MGMGLALMGAFALWAAVSIYDDYRERKAAAKPTSQFVTAGGVPVRVYNQETARDLRVARSLEVRARDARKDREVRELERLVNLPAYSGSGALDARV